MIKIVGINYESFNFPVGEKHIKAGNGSVTNKDIVINFDFTKNEEIIELLLLVDALKRRGAKSLSLDMPYVPFSRQDRVMVKGEPFSLKIFADLINSCGFKSVWVDDAHSDVTTALINNCASTEQVHIFSPILNGKNDYTLICPDGGALKKIYKLAQLLKKKVVTCEKIRNIETGEISGIKVNSDDLRKKECVIVDDICDGGRTFVEIAKQLKLLNSGRIILCITHGFFTKGLQVFDGIIDEIYTREGKVK